jgi:predicted ArsR family transcriptional regulator
MLEKLLRLAAVRGSVDLGALARALQVSRRQVEPMLDTLVRLGYLEQTAAGCDRPCEHCPLRVTCSSESRPRLWRLAARKRRLGRSKLKAT